MTDETMKAEQWSGEERRTAEVGPIFPNDREPTEEELSQVIGDIRVTPNDFFASKGPLFAACWWLNNYAQGGDGKNVLDGDLEDRVTNVVSRLGRKEDQDVVQDAIRGARQWYARRRQPAAR